MLEIIYISEPVNPGDEWDGLVCPFPMRYSTSKFQQTTFLGLQPAVNISFPRNTNSSEKVLAAIRWFAKGVTPQFDIDKFSFFWISLEILSNEFGEIIKEGYTPDCNHRLEKYLACHKQIVLKKHMRKTLKKYLIDKLWASEEQANQLWKMRQMFHGQNHLTAIAMKDVAKLTLILYSKVLEALKPHISLIFGENPFVDISKPEVEFKYLGFKRKINQNDLDK